MGKVLGDLFNAVFSFVFTFGVGSLIVTKTYNLVRNASFTKVHRGLSSSLFYTEKLTCLRHDDNWRAKRIYSGGCKDYWEDHERRKSSY